MKILPRQCAELCRKPHEPAPLQWLQRLGGPADNGTENQIYAFNNDTTWIKGRHTIKFGGRFQQGNYNGFGRQDVAGRASLDFIGTGLPGNTNDNQAGGNAFASFLMGWATDGGIDTARCIGQHWQYFAGLPCVAVH